MNISPKYYFILFILCLFIVFNVLLFKNLKTDIDSIVSQYIYPISSVENKARIESITSRSYYLKSDIDELSNVSFYAYKESLIKKDLLSDKIKNVLLLNYKIVLVDNINSKFIMSYFINAVLLFSLLFAILFKEQTYRGQYYEPKVDYS